MTNLDIDDTLAPKSEQLDAVDLLGGPKTFTIDRVIITGGEQPATIHLAEFPRPWRPGKNMRRVLVGCWGKRSADYSGHRVTLYCDTEVKYGGKPVGGIRISHVSHIDGPKDVPIIPTRGMGAVWHVDPLPEQEPAAPSPADDIADRITELQGEWHSADSDRRKEIEAEVSRLRGQS